MSASPPAGAGPAAGAAGREPPGAGAAPAQAAAAAGEDEVEVPAAGAPPVATNGRTTGPDGGRGAAGARSGSPSPTGAARPAEAAADAAAGVAVARAVDPAAAGEPAAAQGPAAADGPAVSDDPAARVAPGGTADPPPPVGTAVRQDEGSLPRSSADGVATTAPSGVGDAGADPSPAAPALPAPVRRNREGRRLRPVRAVSLAARIAARTSVDRLRRLRTPLVEHPAPAPPERHRRRPHPPTLDEVLAAAMAGAQEPAPDPVAAPEPGADAAAHARTPAGGPRGAVEDDELGELTGTRFGRPGRPLNRAHPFYVGFVGAVGVLVAIGLVNTLTQLSQVVTLLVVSLFLALGLDPVVAWLQNRRLPRRAAIGVVFLGVVGVFAAFVAAVIPPVVTQSSELIARAPEFVDGLLRSSTVQRLDDEYGVVTRLGAELEARAASGQTVSQVFGGVLGAGRAVLSGFFSALTVLVLTLYFLASLRPMTEALYRLFPRSRRRRARLLGDEITRRIGGYVIGQLSVGTLNGVLSFIVMSLLDLPYAAVLAVTVGVLGLIPLVGATLGAVIVVVVALFSSVTVAVVLALYYLLYQQFENYVIVPRVMQRTVEVPGAVAVVAALAGGSLLGILGALIAIPVAAAVLLIVQEVLVPRQDRL